MNSKIIKTIYPYRLLLNLTGKLVALSNRSIYYTQKNIKKLFKNNRF